MVAAPAPSPTSAPVRYAIGDLQGCQGALERLLALIPDATELWLAGDLVNRGPRSLDALRWARDACEGRVPGLSARTVLGNHDLHLLAVAAGIRRPHRSDTLDEILDAPDRDALLHWLRRQPLALHDGPWLMVHAGVLPQWDVDTTLALAAEVQAVLSGPRWRDFLAAMYGNHPARWDDTLEGADRLRVIVNALTRLRFCTADGEMEFATKDSAATPPAGFLPWFDVPRRATRDVQVVFGHWSTLNLMLRPDVVCLDSGCVWGRALSALRLADRHAVQVDCPECAAPA